jgi:2-oxoglutarate dehydrogenase complex dehydrogenase (E1) component-like enzyme
MTPKSLLRHPRTVSSLEDLATGQFQRILPDSREKPEKTCRVLLCSGKIFYDLEQARQDRGRDDIAILRIEQLYPLAAERLYEALKPYAAAAHATESARQTAALVVLHCHQENEKKADEDVYNQEERVADSHAVPRLPNNSKTIRKKP